MPPPANPGQPLTHARGPPILVGRAPSAVSRVPGAMDPAHCSRRLRGGGGGGGAGVYKNGGGPPMVPAEGEPKILSLNPLAAKGTEAKFWLSASKIGRGGGGGGEGGSRGGRRGVQGEVPPFLLRCTAVLIHHSGGGGGDRITSDRPWVSQEPMGPRRNEVTLKSRTWGCCVQLGRCCDGSCAKTEGLPFVPQVATHRMREQLHDSKPGGGGQFGMSKSTTQKSVKKTQKSATPTGQCHTC